MIGIFDSGIGGLTVLKVLHERFPQEDFLYLGDTARLPYGTKSDQTIRKYLEQNINYLLHNQVTAVIVACNSASSVLRDDETWPVPVMGVIRPGAASALQASESLRIGVIGTRATIAGQAYDKALHRLEPRAQVWSECCPLLVPLVEEGWIRDPITNLILFRYLQPLLEHKIDTLILGCTHYPALTDSIAKIAGGRVHLIDSSMAMAEELQNHFLRGQLREQKGKSPGVLRVCVTDWSQTFSEVARNILGEADFVLESVNLN